MSATRPALSPNSQSPARGRGARSWWWWFAISSFAIAVFAVTPYYTASLAELAADEVGVAENYADRAALFQLALYVHASLGGVALLLSPLQFAARLRERRPRVHRTVGRIVLGSIVVGGCAGLVLSTVNTLGPVALPGFATLAVLWVAFALSAYRAVRAGDIVEHRRWATRAFALTYAAVMLRLIIMVGTLLQVLLLDADVDAASDRAYLIAAYLSWIPNLVVVEWYLRRRDGRLR